MREKRFFYLIMAAWELFRLALLVAALTLDIFHTFVLPPDRLLLILTVAAGSLIIPAGALYLFFSRKTSVPLVVLFIVGKLVQAVPCLVSFFIGIAKLAPYFGADEASDVPAVLVMNPVFFFTIFFIDLIFLISLLSLKEGGKTEGPNPPSEALPAENLPVLEETEIKGKNRQGG